MLDKINTWTQRLPFRRPVQYHSSFGGLWTDRLDARKLAEKKLRRGRISQEEFDLLQIFISEGRMIIPGAVSVSTVDAVRKDVASCVKAGERLITYWDSKGQQREPASPEKLRATEAKVIDVHWTIPSVQQAIFCPRIERMLTILFEKPAIAFQTLYFEYGSGQSPHQDTAFVFVDSPLQFVATWIALEDIQPDSGELLYYVGSHRLKDQLNINGTKAVLFDDPEKESYSARLEKRCLEAGLQKEVFLPKKGDVLFWAADLVHGGVPRDGVRTRRSLVTHYCPDDRIPPYIQEEGRTDKDKRLGNGHRIMSKS